MGKIIYAVLAARPSCPGLAASALLPLPSCTGLVDPAELPWPKRLFQYFNLWEKFMGKIYGENLWGKLMGKINGENLWGKLMVLFTIANLLKNVPISSD